MIKAVDQYDFSDYANADFIDFTVKHMKMWLKAVKALQ